MLRSEVISSPVPRDLGLRMAKGAAWMIALRFAVRGIGLVSTAVLARLLVPEDFGLVALAMMVVALLEVLGEFNFEVALLRDQHAKRSHYDTAWTLTLLRGILVAGLLLLLAQPAAIFFGDSRLATVLSVLSIAAVIDGFANIGTVEFRRELHFHREFIYPLTIKMGTVVGTLLAAVWIRNYWALVIGIICGCVVRVGLSFAMSRYRPRPSLSEWRELITFSKWLFFTALLQYAYWRTDRLVVGKVMGAQALGLYAVAYELSNIATSELVAPVRRASLPAYAKVSCDLQTLRSVFVRDFATILFFGVPIAAGIGGLADPLVRVLLGERWLAAVPLMQILAIYGAFQVGPANTGPVYLALGKPQLITVSTALSVAVTLPAVLFGAWFYGAYGAAWGATGGSAVQFLVNLVFIKNLLQLSLLSLASRAGARSPLLLLCY